MGRTANLAIGGLSIDNQLTSWTRPSNMEMRLCWYRNKNGSMWTYDLIDRLMVELETIIALAVMTYIVETNLYELHSMNE